MTLYSRFRYPLPSRIHSRTKVGFSSRPYAISDVLRVCAAGAWFSPQVSYDFESREAASFAREASEFFREVVFHA